jgi:alkanesulfonate monooxygenase SsuD/methylene tetrahydromethanopterin reductase-like flavin-dependent oxidoreductase (luciferase family)
MRFGLFSGARTELGPRPSDREIYADYTDYVVEAEELGFHSIFLVEHHFTGFGQVSATLGFLAYLAARTRTMRLGSAVTVLPWHNPALLAEQAGLVDLLSDGRLDLGIGRGYRYSEFSGFCMKMDEAGERYDEALAFLRAAWGPGGDAGGDARGDGRRFSHHGKRWHFDDIVIEPQPVQKPHPPLWIGANSPQSIREAATQGFNLLLAQHGSPEEVAERVGIYRKEVEAQGRSFDPMRVGLTRALHIAATPAERDAAHTLRMKFMQNVQLLSQAPSGAVTGPVSRRAYGSPEEMRRATENDALIGTPDEIVARLKRYQAGGVAYVMLIDVGGSRAALRQFAREIMPEFG